MLTKSRNGGGAGGIATAVVWLACLFTLAACSSASDSAKSLQPNDKTVIYLVRHAEKEDDSQDPDLTAAGRDRALALARVLDARMVHKLWSSNYARTRQTLLPLSEQKHLPVTLYDARDSSALIRSIMQGPPGQTHVIAGHSNTVPELVDRLEAWPEEPRTQRPNLGHDEYNRLYVVTIRPADARTNVRSQSHKVEERRY